MQESDRPAQQIEQIHAIMARSTTFLSLSGLSGVAAGVVGLIAGRFLFRLMDTLWLNQESLAMLKSSPELMIAITKLFLITLFAALAVAFFFTWRRARKYYYDLWNAASQRFAIHLALPLLAGGVFVFALRQHEAYELICPAMLLFFGLALVSAGKYSFTETVWLGVIELILGLVAAFWVEAGLIIWTLGFGLLTAAYGGYMYLKYER